MNLPAPCMLSRIPLSIAVVCGESGESNALWVLLLSARELGKANSEKPRLTIRSHLRLNLSSSVSCTESLEAQRQAFGLFCAIGRHACVIFIFIGSGRRVGLTVAAKQAETSREMLDVS